MPTDRIVAPALTVARSEAEATRRALLAAGILRFDLKPDRDASNVFFPLSRDVTGFGGRPAAPHAFEPLVRAEPSWQAVAERSIPPDVAAQLPSSFDQIGHVVVLKLPAPLVPFAAVVGHAILDTVRSARSVALDRGVEGELRVRGLDVVAGDPVTLTSLVEHGVRLRVDPARAYFSPRLATERRRVAALVAPGERVADLFAGVGPFSLVIARHARPSRVDAVDLNPAAVELLRENVAANRAGGIVVPHLADARVFAQAHSGVADRAISNVPHSSADFLDAVLRVLKPTGVWHHHAIIAEDAAAAHVEALAARARALGRGLALLDRRVVRSYSPTERHLALDLAVTPWNGS